MPASSVPVIAKVAGSGAGLTAIALAVALSSCGRLGLPSPPVHIMERTGQLQGMQRGSQVLLWWPPPSMTAKPSSKYYVDRVDIYKLMEHRDQEPTVDPDEYLDAAELIKFYPRSEIERQAREKGREEFLDTLDFGGSPRQIANTRIRYAIRYINKFGQEALFSNSVEIDPNPAVAMPPIGLHVSNQVQDRVTLSWSPPAGNVNGQIPANVVGYNLYRRIIGSPTEPAQPAEASTAPAGKPDKKKKATPAQPSGKVLPEFELLNQEPLSEATYTDRKFKYLTQYEYMVRALSAGTSGLIESENSETYSATFVDTFKPSPPDNVSIASANQVISLFWPANPERDVIGYNVYRSERPDAPPGDWIKLNSKPGQPTTYHDETARIGIRYYYRVTAVDRFDNESEPSKILSEVANP